VGEKKKIFTSLKELETNYNNLHRDLYAVVVPKKVVIKYLLLKPENKTIIDNYSKDQTPQHLVEFKDSLKKIFKDVISQSRVITLFRNIDKRKTPAAVVSYLYEVILSSEGLSNPDYGRFKYTKTKKSSWRQ